MLTYSLLYETYLLLIPIHLYYNIFIYIKHTTLNKQKGSYLNICLFSESISARSKSMKILRLLVYTEKNCFLGRFILNYATTLLPHSP